MKSGPSSSAALIYARLLNRDNLFKAVGLSAILTLMTMGRLVHAEKPLGIYLSLAFALMAFALMAFVCGAVTAWGRRAGMPGIMADSQTLVRGLLVAAALSLVSLPIRVYWLDPPIRSALANVQSDSHVELSYSSTVNACLSLVLWSAGFQMIFFQAAPMSFLLVLSAAKRRRWAYVSPCVRL